MTEQSKIVETTENNLSGLTQQDKDIMVRLNCVNIAFNIGVPDKSVTSLLGIAALVEEYLCKGVILIDQSKQKQPRIKSVN